MSEQNNVIRKQPKHTFSKKKVLCLVSNPAMLQGMKVGLFLCRRDDTSIF